MGDDKGIHDMIAELKEIEMEMSLLAHCLLEVLVGGLWVLIVD